MINHLLRHLLILVRDENSGTINAAISEKKKQRCFFCPAGSGLASVRADCGR